MQVSYNYNMVSIVNRRPMTLGILPLLDAFIEHRKDVVIRRTKFYFATEIHIATCFLFFN